MHRSRMAGFIIDCQDADLESAARFWSDALGFPARADPADPRYVRLQTGPGGLHIEVQRVDHPSRIHLDIETDDIEAEVRRLEGLGAKRVSRFPRWWIMEAPTGQRFCVVRAKDPDFEDRSNRWDTAGEAP